MGLAKNKSKQKWRNKSPQVTKLCSCFAQFRLIQWQKYKISMTYLQTQLKQSKIMIKLKIFRIINKTLKVQITLESAHLFTLKHIFVRYESKSGVTEYFSIFGRWKRVFIFLQLCKLQWTIAKKRNLLLKELEQQKLHRERMQNKWKMN